MRTAGLIALIFLAPIFVHASGAPTLTVYTLSSDTVQPLVVSTSIDTAFSEQVKVSIKILSAAGALVKSLYSSSGVTNPSAKIWDGTNADSTPVAAGVYTVLIAATSTATDLFMSDSTKTITVISSAIAASSTPNTTAASTGATTYTPPPSSISIAISGNRSSLLQVPLRLSARVTTKGGAVDQSAQVSWSFGDGSSAVGNDVEKVYRYVGTYLVTAIATDGTAKARDEMIVTVTAAKISISSISGEGITVENHSSDRLDLSGWRLASDIGMFRIPDGMTLLPSSSVLFPYSITNLPFALAATLAYPNGIIAAQYAPLAVSVATTTAEVLPDAQPITEVASYNQVRAVEPIINTDARINAYDEGVGAPRAATELAALGAALPLTSPLAPKPRVSDIFHSPWTLGLLGVMATAAGIFIFL